MTNTELRIGNYVKAQEKYRKAKSMYVDGSVGLDNGFTYSIDLIAPIPLSPLVLNASDHPEWEYEMSVGALKWYFRWNTEWYSEIGGIYIDSRVQYVHQLQNLYHSLTGTELNIKL